MKMVASGFFILFGRENAVGIFFSGKLIDTI